MVAVVGGLVFIAVVALIIVIIVVVYCLLSSQQKGKVEANDNRAQTFGVSANTAYIASNRDGPPRTEEDRNRHSLTASQNSSDIYYDYILSESAGNFRRLQLIPEEDNPTSLGSIIQDNVAYNSPQEVKAMQKILSEAGYVSDLM